MRITLLAGVMVGAVWMASAAKVETVQVRSEVMDKNVPCAVVLPAQYNGSATKRWSVVYVLHGAGGDFRGPAPNNTVKQYSLWIGDD